MSRPLFDARVSVIIPNRNNLDTLPAAIHSIGLQQLDAVEILVIDDGSTDGSREWLSAMARELPQLRVLHTESLGPAGARNLGISEASAPIIAFLDSDDVWLRGKLRVQMEHLERNPEIGMSFTDYRHIGPSGEDRGTCFDYWRPGFRNQPPTHFFALEEAEAMLLGHNLVGTSTVAVRKSLLQNANGFATDLASAEDWDLWLRLAAMAPVAASTMIMTHYLMRPGSLTSRLQDRLGAIEAIAGRYRGRQDKAIRQALRKVDARLARARAEIARKEERHLSAAMAELRACCATPSRPGLRAAAADLVRGLQPSPARI
ncbi:glycosyltransferase family 2 protein [Rhabdaerophilum sp. SD176]|uniref:glycosyltransferase family 2 protein n=1 Tax=Rhabdaerophilum sp. SD176 TaxID=2983548 RepID=UPI0024DF64E6|nr:glycosyltransferase family 2 protein [Rhabdaerophilum sp. SD176]